jgi:hypothetical protein
VARTQMETTEKSMNVIYAGYSLAVTHNINQPPMPTTDKNDQTTVGFIDQNPFIVYIIHFRILATDNTVCVRFGDRDLA